MYLIKTPEGQQAFKERHADLSQRLRSAFLLFDGFRSLAQVLEATAAMGVSKDDVLALVSKGWLVQKEAPAMAGGAAMVAPAQVSKSAVPSLAPANVDPASTKRRYQQAYPVAVSITGGLGLKGFRLNLAVEAAMGYEQLAEIAPRIRDAVGDKAYAPLHKVLFAAEAE
ncbi:hypothetical protein KUF54_17205 [Comamonas sp. Y33R10-2]|uniref:hypothetical protein n=1 Tax=Comamonas sp. Y33R10-2 TaxID=2853257 RepID=UPI001C5CC047|nr:hypothetical protein [Comamonas sp. Y33R10-2]QXZ09705.1 hypothetical protein KUF54_17205 [Comamonas sp. Y33R10-2]